MLTAVHGKHDDRVANRSKTDGVRKAPEHRSPNRPVHLGKRRRILRDSLNRALEGFCELGSETGASTFVPTLHFRRLNRGFGPKSDGPCHRPPRS